MIAPPRGAGPRGSLCTFLLAAAAFDAIAQSPTAAPIVVGVLETPDCGPSTRAVRPLFVRLAAGWVSLSDTGVTVNHPMPDEWEIAFDGRDRGRVHTVPRGGEATLRPTPPAGLFEGWCSPPELRPLVVVSAANFEDPDQWKPARLSDGELGSLLAPLVGERDSAFNCPRDVEKAEPFRPRVADLEVTQAYRDRRGRTIAGVRLRRSLYRCDFLFEGAWLTHWFELGASPHRIGTDLDLVDAGDYDRDGASELIFWQGAYNRDGYVLVTGDLRRRVEHAWSYH